MTKLAIRILLSALVFTHVLPHIPGAHFGATFWPEGVIYGALLAVVAYLFDWVLTAFAIGTLGLGVILIVLGFWFIPAIQLQILAHFFPHYLSFNGWGSATISGLIMCLVNLLTMSRREA